MKIAIASLLLLLTIAPTYGGPLCNGLIDRAIDAAAPPFPFECDCGLRILRRVRFNCNAEVCLNEFEGQFDDVLPIELPILYDESSCLEPTFKGRFPKRGNGDIDVGGCTGAATMVVDIDQLVKDATNDQDAQATDFDLDPKMDFNIPNTCLDVSTSSRPGLRDPSISISGCSATIGGKACTCTPCGAGSGIEIGADCVNELFSSMIPTELSENAEPQIAEKFTFDVTEGICIGGENLFTGRGVVDIMLTPYVSQL